MPKRKKAGALFSLVVDPGTSARLAKVRQRDTAPELRVRALLRSLGVSYRVRNRDLPGAPDIANRRALWAIYVHGCFWHAHDPCRRATVPKRNREFWCRKFATNSARDARVIEELRRAGFRVGVIWACELDERPKAVANRLRRIVGQTLGKRDS